MYYSLYVGRLPHDTTKEELMDLFSDCGAVMDAITFPDKRYPFGYGFVRFKHPQTVVNVLKEGEWTFRGNVLHLEIASESLEAMRLVMSVKHPSSNAISRDNMVRSRLKEACQLINRELDLVNGDVLFDSSWVVSRLEAVPSRYGFKLTGSPCPLTTLTYPSLCKMMNQGNTLSKNNGLAKNHPRSFEVKQQVKSLLCDLTIHLRDKITANLQEISPEMNSTEDSGKDQGQSEDKEVQSKFIRLPKNIKKLMSEVGLSENDGIATDENTGIDVEMNGDTDTTGDTMKINNAVDITSKTRRINTAMLSEDRDLAVDCNRNTTLENEDMSSSDQSVEHQIFPVFPSTPQTQSTLNCSRKLYNEQDSPDIDFLKTYMNKKCNSAEEGTDAAWHKRQREVLNPANPALIRQQIFYWAMLLGLEQMKQKNLLPANFLELVQDPPPEGMHENAVTTLSISDESILSVQDQKSPGGENLEHHSSNSVSSSCEQVSGGPHNCKESASTSSAVWPESYSESSLTDFSIMSPQVSLPNGNSYKSVALDTASQSHCRQLLNGSDSSQADDYCLPSSRGSSVLIKLDDVHSRESSSVSGTDPWQERKGVLQSTDSLDTEQNLFQKITLPLPCSSTSATNKGSGPFLCGPLQLQEGQTEEESVFVARSENGDQGVSTGKGTKSGIPPFSKHCRDLRQSDMQQKISSPKNDMDCMLLHSYPSYSNEEDPREAAYKSMESTIALI